MTSDCGKPCPNYVFAVYTDSPIDRLLKVFVDFGDAERSERSWRQACSPGDNYFVQLVFGDHHAEQQINELCKERRLPVEA